MFIRFLSIIFNNYWSLAQQNLFFRENVVGSEVAGVKMIFVAIFDPTLTHILVPRRPKNGIPYTKF